MRSGIALGIAFGLASITWAAPADHVDQPDASDRPQKESNASRASRQGADAPGQPEPSRDSVDFRRDVFPILSQHCVRCHSSDEPNGDFQITGRDELLTGGYSGPAIVPGNSGQSLLIQLVSGAEEDRIMPAEGPRLSAKQIGILQDWIDQGAAWEEAAEYRLMLRDVQLPDGEGNPVDRLLEPYFKAHGVATGVSISDERFARRAALDLLGRPLTSEQLATFLADSSADKREKLIQRLLADEANYAAHWMTFWSDHLRIGSAIDAGIFDGDATETPQKWLKAQLDRNVPYDQFVEELIAGDFFEAYAKSIAPPGEVASQVDRHEMQLAAIISQVFLGIQLKCASCHDSFVDRWTMQDAWGLASALGNQKCEIYRCEVATGELAAPRFPLAGLGHIDPAADAQQRRRQVAELMTCRENGLFARTIVNRLWARLIGRGLVEPLDEMMEHEPWRPELLGWLAAELVRHDYDLKRILYLIAASEAYQRPAVVREEEADVKDYVFRGPEIRRLTAEQFIDALSRLEPSSGHDQQGPRAWQLENDPLMTMLGRPGREVVVTSRHQDTTALTALEFINGNRLERLVQQAAQAQLAQAKAADELALRIHRALLGRDPTPQEQAVARRLLGSSPSQDAVADFIWTLIMLPEFQLIL